MRTRWCILLLGLAFVAANLAAETNGYSPAAINDHLAAMKAKAPNTPTRLPVSRQRIAPRLLLQNRMESRVETGHVVDIWQETSGGPDGFDREVIVERGQLVERFDLFEHSASDANRFGEGASPVDNPVSNSVDAARSPGRVRDK